MKRPAWLRSAAPLAAVLVSAWALPGSAAVTALWAQPRTQHVAQPFTRPAASRLAPSQPAGSCDPTASLRPAGGPQVTPGSFMARIRARGYLIAGVDQNSYHFGFLNPLTGTIEGFDIDMVRAVAAAIFGNADKVQYKAISDAQRIPDIQSGAVDIVAHTMTINCDRLRQVGFSTVYYDAGQRVLVQSGSPVRGIGDLGGQKVCATAGSTSIANIEAAPSRPIPVAVPYWTDCLVLLQQGQVAAISTDDSILAGLAAQDPWTTMVGPRFTNEPYGLAISKQHPDFVRFVNAVLEQLRSDRQWAASYARWVGTPVPAPPPARYQG
ncbi:MAG TPA: glutamate ABC transporter substrate-binding protein [Streptosporangiaceae bacterium]|nr:glutamate ABC transporter substrate-binding protein [Streptosporangiaceae bacterium]